MRECFTYGSVRGAARKGRPYRDRGVGCSMWLLDVEYSGETALGRIENDEGYRALEAARIR